MEGFKLKADRTVWTIGFDFEHQAISEGYTSIAGVDEVGRGCLAGPVVAAACILHPDRPVPKGLNDSKKLTEKARDEIAAELRETALCYAVAEVDAAEIDRVNILRASIKAMCLAINKLRPCADYLLVDAVQLREIPLPQKALIKGDSISYSIAAASVLAKTYRDEMMKRLDTDFPAYGFAQHVGYG
nr:ribonuclease HII [Blastocatellia bacterium]